MFKGCRSLGASSLPRDDLGPFHPTTHPSHPALPSLPTTPTLPDLTCPSLAPTAQTTGRCCPPCGGRRPAPQSPRSGRRSGPACAKELRVQGLRVRGLKVRGLRVRSPRSGRRSGPACTKRAGRAFWMSKAGLQRDEASLSPLSLSISPTSPPSPPSSFPLHRPLRSRPSPI